MSAVPHQTSDGEEREGRMAETWRLLDTGPRPAAGNMALDEVVLTARSRDLVPNTLRFLQFAPPCTLVGYHQSVEQEIRIPYCHEHSIEINRRLTGGGGLFWGESEPYPIKESQ